MEIGLGFGCKGSSMALSIDQRTEEPETPKGEAQRWRASTFIADGAAPSRPSGKVMGCGDLTRLGDKSWAWAFLNIILLSNMVETFLLAHAEVLTATSNACLHTQEEFIASLVSIFISSSSAAQSPCTVFEFL